MKSNKDKMLKKKREKIEEMMIKIKETMGDSQSSKKRRKKNLRQILMMS